jgi:ribosomal protein S18 acetylase RimI-like enzyme
MSPSDVTAASAVKGPDVRVLRADLEQPEDAEALLHVLDAYARDPMGDGQALSAEARACLIPALRRMSSAIVFLALGPADAAQGALPAFGSRVTTTETPAVVVGAAVCFVGFSTFRARGLINVHDLAVLPSWRGQGIGTRLLAAVEAFARRRGYCKVNLEVRVDNRARHLYRRLGYGAGTTGGGEATSEVQSLFLEKRLD